LRARFLNVVTSKELVRKRKVPRLPTNIKNSLHRYGAW